MNRQEAIKHLVGLAEGVASEHAVCGSDYLNITGEAREALIVLGVSPDELDGDGS